MHFKFDYWTEGEDILGDQVTLCRTWTNLRLFYKSSQLVIYLALGIVSGLVFFRVVKALESEEAFKPLCKQVYTFSIVYFVQMVLRVASFTAFNGIWVVQNYFRDSFSVSKLASLQEWEIVLASVGELVLIFFLVTYLFSGRAKGAEDENDDELARSTRQTTHSDQSQPQTVTNEDLKAIRPLQKPKN